MKYENVFSALETHCFHLNRKTLSKLAIWTIHNNGKQFYIVHKDHNPVDDGLLHISYIPVDEDAFKLFCELSYCIRFYEHYVIIKSEHWQKIMNQIKLYESI